MHLPTTQRQREVLTTIHNLSLLYGFAPTVRELGDELDITSANGVVDHLRALAKRELIDWDRRRARTLRLTWAGEREIGVTDEDEARAS